MRRITTFLIYFRNGEWSNTRLTKALSVKCTKIIKESRKLTKRRFFKSSEEIKLLDCLQSAFFLKIRLVLISSSAIANHDVIRREKTSYFFLSGLRPCFSRLASLGFACSNFAKKTKRLLAVYKIAGLRNFLSGLEISEMLVTSLENSRPHKKFRRPTILFPQMLYKQVAFWNRS